MQICDWNEFDEQVCHLRKSLAENKMVSPPFPVLALTGSLTLQRNAATIWAQEKHPARGEPPANKKLFASVAGHARICIGYYSADFHNHATAYLMAELFERHDKSKFEVVAISFGPNIDDAMRKRLTASFDQFIHAGDMSDGEVGQLSRTLGIDIAVDLKGHTQDSRPIIE